MFQTSESKVLLDQRLNNLAAMTTQNRNNKSRCAEIVAAMIKNFSKCPAYTSSKSVSGHSLQNKNIDTKLKIVFNR